MRNSNDCYEYTLFGGMPTSTRPKIDRFVGLVKNLNSTFADNRNWKEVKYYITWPHFWVACTSPLYSVGKTIEIKILPNTSKRKVSIRNGLSIHLKWTFCGNDRRRRERIYYKFSKVVRWPLWKEFWKPLTSFPAVEHHSLNNPLEFFLYYVKSLNWFLF